jgi:hypothetical protein
MCCRGRSGFSRNSLGPLLVYFRDNDGSPRDYGGAGSDHSAGGVDLRITESIESLSADIPEVSWAPKGGSPEPRVEMAELRAEIRRRFDRLELMLALHELEHHHK